MKVNKVMLCLLAIVVFLAGLAFPDYRAEALEQSEKVRYVSLGDSLAAGFHSDLIIRDGFSDYTAEHFKEKGTLEAYTKLYAVGGYKTTDVLRDLKLRPVLKDKLEEANLVSISAGANDALSLAGVDLKTGEIKVDEAKVEKKMKEISDNYAEILRIIKTLNPDAEIYAMGYYFPYPHLDEKQKPRLVELTKTLNDVIASAAEKGGATYVDVYSRFGDDAKHLLPNKNDIHPNAEGHKVMSEALLDEVIRGVVDIKGHWAEKEIQELVDKGLMVPDKSKNIYPEKEITRAEVAEILYELIPDRKAGAVANPGFSDVPASHPSYQAIAYLTQEGVFAKTSKFNPDAPLQRIQLAKVITLALDLKAKGKPVSFKDVPVNYWGYPVVQAVATNGLMVGERNNKFDLYRNVTKAQFAAVSVRAGKLK